MSDNRTRVPRHLREVAALAENAGWRIEQCGSGHLKFLAPDEGPMLVVSSSPSDHRMYLNMVSQFRKAGLDIARKNPKKKVKVEQ